MTSSISSLGGNSPDCKHSLYMDIECSSPFENTNKVDAGIEGVFALTKEQEFKLGISYRDESVTGNSRGAVLAKLGYEQHISLDDRFDNSTRISIGYLGRKETIASALYSDLMGYMIGSMVYGLRDDLDMKLIGGKALSLHGRISASILGQEIPERYLDYGMSRFNWDSSNTACGIVMKNELSGRLSLESGFGSGLDSYNTSLYFFLDRVTWNEFFSSARYAINRDMSARASYSLVESHGYEGEVLKSNVDLGMQWKALALSASATFDHGSSGITSYAVNLDCLTSPESGIAINLRYDGRCIPDGSINSAIYASTRLCMGAETEKKRPEAESGMKYQVNNLINTKNAPQYLNTAEKVSDFFYYNVRYGSAPTQVEPGDTVLDYRMGVCAHQAFAQSSLLAKLGYDSYYLAYEPSPSENEPWHAITVFKDGDRWYNMEYGGLYRLSMKQPVGSPEQACQAILRARKEYSEQMAIYYPPCGRPDWTDNNVPSASFDHVDLLGPKDDGTIKLVPQMGARSRIGDDFWN